MKEIKIPESIPQLEEFSGNISVPENPTGRMFSAWWEAYHEKHTGSDNWQNSIFMQRWRGAVALLNGYGKVDIEGVNNADVESGGDNVPMSLITWIGTVVDVHMAQFVNLKKTVDKS